MSPSKIDAVVGRRLRLFRLLANLTMDELAQLLGMTGREIADCEDGIGRFKPVHIAEVARRFQLPVSWFFFTFEDDDFELCMLHQVEMATESGHPKDMQFLSKISELIGDYMPFGPPEDRSLFIERARILIAERNAG